VGLLGDFNLAKFTIPISIQKSFDKGEIEKVYQKMYRVADELSHEDARKYLMKKSTRYKELKYLNPEKILRVHQYQASSVKPMNTWKEDLRSIWTT
jgi:hypothetical protein